MSNTNTLAQPEIVGHESFVIVFFLTCIVDEKPVPGCKAPPEARKRFLEDCFSESDHDTEKACT